MIARERFASLSKAALLIVAIALSRLIPHPPNMTLMNAGGHYARSRFGPIGLLVPILSILISDMIIGFYDWRLLLSVYGAFTLVSVFGVFLSTDASVHRIFAVSTVGSTLFFLITNTAVWALSAWYPHTFFGFLACLAAGLPFYRNMLIGDCLAACLLYKFSPVYSHVWHYGVISKSTSFAPVSTEA